MHTSHRVLRETIRNFHYSSNHVMILNYTSRYRPTVAFLTASLSTLNKQWTWQPVMNYSGALMEYLLVVYSTHNTQAHCKIL